ncbi:MAG TPA: hypothetical protein VG206_18540 [Terriglobia bacterium]|nr:hypothetical protein [Terriglobia bacterium]
MPKRIKDRARPKDVNEWAHQIGQESTSERPPSAFVEPPAPATPAQISMFMAELGKKGGRIGGKRKLETMSSRQRTALAKKAANARWGKRTKVS